ncbi:MAG TPA: hypothetical protein PLW80_03470 [Spirochaetales bacterium]|nr:hypothetical protein [Spirochaetales bacterium]
MDIERLQRAEASFMERYPGGFEHPEMLERGRRHRIGRLVERARTVLAPERFDDSERMAEDIIKTVASSSMVSIFEKPAFRDLVRSLSAKERARLCSHLFQLLHGDAERGFEDLSAFLASGKMAKWTVMTVFPFYTKPTEEPFVKPTTAKEIIAYYGLEGLAYRPRPYWAFYSGYRGQLRAMMGLVSPLVAPDMGSFSAFLMIGAGAW